MSPIACPRCKQELIIKHRAGDHYCANCIRWFSDEYIEACGRSTDLQSVQISLFKIVITPKPKSDDRRLIRTLFDAKDVVYDRIHGRYVICNILKYTHLKCVQTACLAWLDQYHFLEAA